MPAGSKPGERRGGRVKGTPNKVTQETLSRIDAVMNKYDCDPIESMVLIGREAWEKGDLTLAGSMFKEIAQYVAPKRRSIEVRTANEQERVTFAWSALTEEKATTVIDVKSKLIEQV